MPWSCQVTNSNSNTKLSNRSSFQYSMYYRAQYFCVFMYRILKAQGPPGDYILLQRSYHDQVDAQSANPKVFVLMYCMFVQCWSLHGVGSQQCCHGSRSSIRVAPFISLQTTVCIAIAIGCRLWSLDECAMRISEGLIVTTYTEMISWSRRCSECKPKGSVRSHVLYVDHYTVYAHSNVVMVRDRASGWLPSLAFKFLHHMYIPSMSGCSVTWKIKVIPASRYKDNNE